MRVDCTPCLISELTTMSETASWQPSAPIANLLKRAAIMAEIRRFFADRGVLEVETPTMSQATVTDIHLVPFETRFVGPGAADGLTLYMMTSPEYHMKRLLAAGSGSIYQLGRSFRNEEAGRHHNPEFTMLEWYRPHYDMYRLMNEVDDLLQQILDCNSAETLSYQQAFQRHLGIDPLSAEKAQLREAAAKLDLSNVADTEEDRDTLLQLLFTVGVEPHIGRDKPAFVYHFPASQASLAVISTEDHRVAERFEVYFKGIELANGFHELTDGDEQLQRFEQDNRSRAKRGLPQHPIDMNLIAALKHGLPDCSGVALGVDRLVMLALNAERLSDVIAFPVDIA
ncbi:lysyl-tRNA synthetase [Yersinia mollaretii ATCC 43969]|uniref:Elongation factor P--(R)-beta-lysine ligase n=2 Tax=Yersinia mollaretii TaxID=33060 RepID=A0ABM9YCX5_YERMW|nr:lysyl-tRNA synthetase [Yersinia mollaretii ATCC 43969]